MTFSITNSELHARQQVTIFDDDGTIYTFTGESPLYGPLTQALLRSDFDEARRLATSRTRIRDEFLELSDHVSISGGTVMYDGEEMYGRLAEHIVEFHENGWPLQNLVRFAERIHANPSHNSRKQLYEFLDRYDFVITENGTFIAYKGVNANGRSIFSGYGVVDGVEYQSANLPNNVGSVVQIPRERVDDNVNNGCSVGLHVGTWEYAHSFGRGRTLKVEVDPANVVSVPHDVSHQKVRVTEYKVLEVRNEPETHQDYYDNRDDDEMMEDVEERMLDDLFEEAADYTRKGKVGVTYFGIFERIYDRPLTEAEQDVAHALQENHTANAVYRYHIDALLEE